MAKNVYAYDIQVLLLENKKSLYSCTLLSLVKFAQALIKKAGQIVNRYAGLGGTFFRGLIPFYTSMTNYKNEIHSARLDLEQAAAIAMSGHGGSKMYMISFKRIITFTS